MYLFSNKGQKTRIDRYQRMRLFTGILGSCLLLLTLWLAWLYGYKGLIWVFVILGPGYLAAYSYIRWRYKNKK